MLQDLTVHLNEYLRNNDKGRPVHIITDARNMEQFPTTVSSVRSALKQLAPFGIDIIIGFDNPIVRFIASVISKLSKFEVRMVKDMDEALATLSQLDPSLSLIRSTELVK